MRKAVTGTSIDAHTLKKRIADHEALTIIDVRTPAEFASTHISGSHNLPLAELSQRTQELAEHLNDAVVLVCQSGVRAVQAQQQLAAAGIDNTEVLTGGVPAFESAGGRVVRGAQRWAMDRQVRLTAGSLVLLGFLGSKLVSPRLGYLSAAIGAGLTFSAVTNSCGLAAVLARMPWNRTPGHTADGGTCGLPASRRTS
ncbi:rhodanese-like domain-containing protein [Saccharomonospora azurea]|jgi:rhodanese-related sulfurtransferase|uniref:Rhodanese-related sulfurtransferase n=1 Tax=Saccharomonospora azurea NA-128 TaxID=882081 RepID=H8GF03_9PSEU|nr:MULTISPECIES: rhodanese-like domain-containing protein [Saccharomonospora]EHK86107.1 hypothetical protein SZMC14600_15405 [Saccharomonospora azurea SZMC 14600]EHY91034.1 Rhodanese-related sulfurtransferase [Saccharomonospora azurea NA-128]